MHSLRPALAIALIGLLPTSASALIKGYRLVGCGTRAEMEARIVQKAETTQDVCGQGFTAIHTGGITCRAAKAPGCGSRGLACNSQFSCIEGVSPLPAVAEAPVAAPAPQASKPNPEPAAVDSVAAKLVDSAKEKVADLAKTVKNAAAPAPTAGATDLQSVAAKLADTRQKTAQALAAIDAADSETSKPNGMQSASAQPSAARPAVAQPAHTQPSTAQPAPRAVAQQPATNVQRAPAAQVTGALAPLLMAIPAMLGSFFLIINILTLLHFLLALIGLWKMFVKAGRPGWQSIVPFLNLYRMHQMAGQGAIWFLLDFVPFVNLFSLTRLFVHLSRRFGHGNGMAALMIFFPGIANAYLGFKSDVFYSETTEEPAPMAEAA
jgi:hypothetical protein